MALCLTRRPGQRLLFSRPDIKITVESVEGKTVRLVIDALQSTFASPAKSLSTTPRRRSRRLQRDRPHSRLDIPATQVHSGEFLYG